MDSVAVTVPLRPPLKKMKKRKELDALAPPHAVSRRSSGKRSSQELLTDSSDERSEYWNISTTTRSSGSRKPRRESGRRGPRSSGLLLHACSVFFGGAVVLATTVLIWLFVDVRQQLTLLRAQLDQVKGGREVVDDAIHRCHILEKNFNTNVSHINQEIDKINKTIDSFSAKMTNLQLQLQQVQAMLKSVPDLTQVPNKVKELEDRIGSLELATKDVQAEAKKIKDTGMVLQDHQEEQRKNLSKIQNSLNSLMNETHRSQMSPNNETIIAEEKSLRVDIARLSDNLTRINETLTGNITQALQEFSKDRKTLEDLRNSAVNAIAQIRNLQQECMKKSDKEALKNWMNEELANMKNNQGTIVPTDQKPSDNN